MIVVFKSNRQILRYAHGPGIVVSANQNEWAFSQLSEAGIRGGHYAEFAILRHDWSYRPGKRNNIVDVKTATFIGRKLVDCPALEIDRVGRDAETIGNPTRS